MGINVDSKRLAQLADAEVVAIAVALPWSTSATSILIGIWLITVLPTLSPATIWRELKTPAGGLPVMLWLLGTLGMLWADVGWSDRFAGLGSFDRLLTIPLLLAQFRHSANGRFVFYGFLTSAAVLLVASWALALGLMRWQANQHFDHFGVPVHDVIAQSTIFLICTFALIWAIRDVLLERNWWVAISLAGLASLFLANLMFIAVSRADVLVTPLLVILLGWRWLSLRGVIVAAIVTAILAASAWMSSPYLRGRLQEAVRDVEIYRLTGVHNDVGDHVEFLRKSLVFVRQAPVIGHGTGSIPKLFAHSTVGHAGAAAISSVNPHNQILAVAIQLGMVGAAVLLAMWFAHYSLFMARDLIGWIGAVVIVENVISSMSSSHLFDFVHGWLYVIGVGVTGGLSFKSKPVPKAKVAGTWSRPPPSPAPAADCNADRSPARLCKN